MKQNQKEAVDRLRTLYDKKGENQIFARMQVALPAQVAENIRRKQAGIPLDAFPSAAQIFPHWEEYLVFHDTLADDWVPSIYPLQYDQGIYGALFGAQMELNRAGGAVGAVSSMTSPLEDKTLAQLLELVGHPDADWIRRMETDLRYLADRSRGRWGVAVTITIDGINFCMQLRGNQTMLDIYDCPDELKALMQAAVALNIEFVTRQRAAINMEYAGGVYDYFNAGWMPKNSIPMSVDCYNLCNPDVYQEFGLPYQQQLIDNFGGGNFHIHGNGRQLLPELARLKGYVAASIDDDGAKTKAIDDLENVKRQAGSITPVITCDVRTFRRKLQEKSLLGGIYYRVTGLPDIAEANRLMESVRSYRV